MKRFERLLEPSYIGTVKTRNRIIKAGASTCYWHENDFHISEKAKAYYEALARGGVGLLIVESPTIDYPLGARWKERYRIDDDKYIPGLKELTQVIHRHGCPTFMQMWHDGPWAGMEAARVAALRGHEVSLFEKGRRVGGSLLLAAMVKGVEREDLLSLIRYLERQTTKLGVKTGLDTEISPSLLNPIKPDVLVVAVGGRHQIPELPAMKGLKVITGRDLHKKLKVYLGLLGPGFLRWLTKFWMPLGRRVVVMGGGVQGCQLAEFLVKRGRKVTVVDTTEEIGYGLLETLVRPSLLNWLIEKGVNMMPGVKYEEITDQGLILTTQEGERQTLEADTIVTAFPLLPDTELLKSLEGSITEFYAIGDCRTPNKIIDAIADGSRIARAI